MCRRVQQRTLEVPQHRRPSGPDSLLSTSEAWIMDRLKPPPRSQTVSEGSGEEIGAEARRPGPGFPEQRRAPAVEDRVDGVVVLLVGGRPRARDNDVGGRVGWVRRALDEDAVENVDAPRGGGRLAG